MVDHINDEVETSLQCELNSLSHSSDKKCIYKVHECISKVNPECYQPSVVSIGPMHYSNPTLKQSNELKLRHLQRFLEISGGVDKLGQYIDKVKGWEEEARGYYAEKISLSSNEFVKMLMVDAAFIIVFFMPRHCKIPKDPTDKGPTDKDPMYNKIEVICQVQRDLFVEENQLPFFVLHNLYHEAFGAANPSFSESLDILIPISSSYLPGRETELTIRDSYSFKDLTCDYISSSYLPGRETALTIGRQNLEKATKVNHLVDVLRIFNLPTKLRDRLADHQENNAGDEFPLTAKELKAAGVKFIATKTSSLLDIKFSINEGIFEVPTFTIQDGTEAVYRNIMFYEQCHHHFDSYFIDYVLFLDKLIDTPEDVRILVQHGIIDSRLGSDDEVADFFNEITKHVLMRGLSFYYTQVSKDLNTYASVRWNKWKAILRRDYFNHPWSIMSLIYLVLLLILTVLQVYTGFVK